MTNDEYRVWNRAGQPILYPKTFFDVLNPALPAGWCFVEYDDGEYHLQPAEASGAGFHEDYFCSNGDLDAFERARLALHTILKGMATDCGDVDRPLIEKALRDVSNWRPRVSERR